MVQHLDPDHPSALADIVSGCTTMPVATAEDGMPIGPTLLGPLLCQRPQFFVEIVGAKVLNRLLDGFEGKLTNAKWTALTKTSSDTALRDLTDLLKRGILVKDEGAGRGTSYSLVEVER